MAEIKPFRGYRPKKDLVEKVVSPPYDVLSSEEAREMAGDNAVSFLHVIKPEIDFPEGFDVYNEEVYKKGAMNLSLLISGNILVKDTELSMYVYSQKMGEHCQTGLVALASAQEYIDGKIKRHEHTKPDKVRDRTAHIKEQGAHTGPVFLTYRADKEIDSVVEEVRRQDHEVRVVSGSAVEHTLWKVTDSRTLSMFESEFKKVKDLYIADGHHRSASAVENYIQDNTGQNAFFLAVLFPDNQLQIMDYNRAVKDLNGLDEETFIKQVSRKFSITPSKEPKPGREHTAGMYIGGKWYMLEVNSELIDETDPVKRLDVSLLQDNLLEPVLGIKDPKTDKRIDFIGGIRGIKELEKLVDSGNYKVAFAMYPLKMNDLLAIADAGEVMPPKSTWFEPKLLSGLVVNVFK